MKNIFLFFLISTSFISAAQNLPAGQSGKKNDLALISSHLSGEPKTINTLNTISPLKTKHQNVIAKYNPVTLLFSGMMLFYQHVVSSQINATCVYTRSCSNFAKEAIAEYGIIKGIFLGTDRLMRCNIQCANDFPSYAFTIGEKATDEPSAYQFR